MPCSNVHINWTNIYSLLTKRRHFFFWREQSLLSKSYTALGWPLQCWREMSGQIIPCLFLPSMEWVYTSVTSGHQGLTQSGEPRKQTGATDILHGAGYSRRGATCSTWDRSTEAGKGEGARCPSPTVARAAPPHAGNGRILTLMTQSSLATMMFPATQSPAEGTTPIGIRRPWSTNDKLCDYR